MNVVESNRHRTDLRLKLRLVSLSLLTILSLLACNPIESARVDDCLDRGGSYNYEAKVCDFDKSHTVP